MLATPVRERGNMPIMRNVTFGKKMAIIYSVEGNIVDVIRIMPQSMIIL